MLFNIHLYWWMDFWNESSARTFHSLFFFFFLEAMDASINIGLIVLSIFQEWPLLLRQATDDLLQTQIWVKILIIKEVSPWRSFNTQHLNLSLSLLHSCCEAFFLFICVAGYLQNKAFKYTEVQCYFWVKLLLMGHFGQMVDSLQSVLNNQTSWWPFYL